ncbi:hypothetical protein [Xanthomonas cerealis]|uniref:hypothetical protein n=1 Tax=Xanthomonas cerealis TaxID=3390025 RepID=UPI00163C3DD8|nr:hypothetical protein [Xanthomonas translucens]
MATNEAGLQAVLREAQQLSREIAEQAEHGDPGLQPILESLNKTIRKINGKLNGSLGSRGPDEYRSEIQQVRRDFNAFNEAAGGYQGANFGYSGVLHSGSFGGGAESFCRRRASVAVGAADRAGCPARSSAPRHARRMMRRSALRLSLQWVESPLPAEVCAGRRTAPRR